MAKGIGLVNLANENTDAQLNPNSKETQINCQCKYSPNISWYMVIPKIYLLFIGNPDLTNVVHFTWQTYPGLDVL